jgi:hypothetical protein
MEERIVLLTCSLLQGDAVMDAITEATDRRAM